MKDLPNTKVLFLAAILKDKGHLSKVVALQPLVGTEVESDIHEKTEVSPTQVKLAYINGGLWTTHRIWGISVPDWALLIWNVVGIT